MDPGKSGFGVKGIGKELGAIREALDVVVEGRLLQRCVVGGKGKQRGGTERRGWSRAAEGRVGAVEGHEEKIGETP